MSTTAPLFFMPIDPDGIGELNSWDDVWPLLDPHVIGTEIQPPLRMASSRNWWHLQTTKRFADKVGVSGLKFIESERRLLDTREIAAAIHALTTLLERIRTESESPDYVRDVDRFFLPMFLEESGSEVSAADAVRSAYREATAKQKVEVTSDAGYPAIIDYFCFLKSLLASLVEALIEGKSFLWAEWPC